MVHLRSCLCSGKLTKKPIKRAVIDDSLMMSEKQQQLYSDVMHWNSNMFLVTVCDPLQLIMSTHIDRETGDQLGLALQGQLDLLRSRGFIPTVIYTDPAPGFQRLVNHFPGVIVDTGGAQDTNANIDIRIRRIKELCRSVKESLLWKLPKTLVKDLVAYAVARKNILRTTAINLNVCPKVLFTGLKINFAKELGLEFGTYAEVYDGTDNTSRSRSVPCIALYLCNNATGSWEFLNLKTRTRIRRSHWVRMKTSQLIIDIMNHYEEKEFVALPEELRQEQEQEQTPVVIPEAPIQETNIEVEDSAVQDVVR